MSQAEPIRCYLVTGCAGFIGWHVCRRLLELGHEVLGVDNLGAGYDPRLKQWRLEDLAARAGFHFVRADLTAPETELDAALSPVAATAPFAGVIHLAARAGVRQSIQEPWDYYRTNVQGTLHMLQWCRRKGVPKFVLASSSSVYGARNRAPYAEDADTSHPLSPYAASKKAAETLTYSFHHLYGLDVSVLRFFTVYGPAGRPDMSIFRFIRRIAEGQPITVWGDGSQQRDFTFVDDIVRGTCCALQPLGYEVINLGGTGPQRLLDVINKITRLVGHEARIEFRAAQSVEVPATWADAGKAARLFDWRPAVTFDEGLAACVAWYRQHREWVRTLDDAG